MAAAVGGTAVVVREYREGDERAWLRCRAVAFLGTAYFDDVLQKKPRYDAPAVELVAESGGSLVALMDVAVHAQLATIETVAVHPDCVRAGIATELLHEAFARLDPDVEAIDAWTRDHGAANRWYESHGFDEGFRYLHVYATGDEETAAAIDRTHFGLALSEPSSTPTYHKRSCCGGTSRESTSVGGMSARYPPLRFQMHLGEQAHAQHESAATARARGTGDTRRLH